MKPISSRTMGVEIRSSRRSSLSLVAAFVMGGFLLAETGPVSAKPDGERSGRRGPPPEAISACENLDEGSACSFTGRRGDASGQCIQTPDEQLACAPEGHGSRKNNGERK
jgi:hypothetical protein